MHFQLVFVGLSVAILPEFCTLTIENMEDIEDRFSPTSALQDRHLLACVGNQQVAFPSHWVAEIFWIERTQILSLPFYSPVLLGVVHHRGLVVPLILSHLLLPKSVDLEIQPDVLTEQLSVILCGQSAQHLSGVGIVVDRVIDQYQKQPSLNISESTSIDMDFAPIDVSSNSPLLFQLTDVPDSVWQPL